MAHENNVTFSLKKLQLCTDIVKYSGQQFTEEGLEMDPDRIRAVVEMPEPSSINQVQTLLGMVMYVCKYLKNLSSITEPLRSLIKESNEKGFTWHFDKIHQQTFVMITRAMTNALYYSITS